MEETVWHDNPLHRRAISLRHQSSGKYVEKRGRVIWEIIQTEKVFHRLLGEIKHSFADRLLRKQDTVRAFEVDSNVLALCNSIGHIYRLSTWLVNELEAILRAVRPGACKTKQCPALVRPRSRTISSGGSARKSRTVRKVRLSASLRALLAGNSSSTVSNIVRKSSHRQTRRRSNSVVQVPCYSCLAAQRIGYIFKRVSPLFQVYKQYAVHHAASCQRIASLDQDNRFERWWHRAGKGMHPITRQSAKLSLQSYLILPIQRIPRYVLLLKELCSEDMELQTPESETSSLRAAKLSVEQAASAMNVGIKENIQRNELIKLHKQFIPGSAPHHMLLQSRWQPAQRFMVCQGDFSVDFQPTDLQTESSPLMKPKPKTQNMRVHLLSDALLFSHPATQSKTKQVSYVYFRGFSTTEPFSVSIESSQRMTVSFKWPCPSSDPSIPLARYTIQIETVIPNALEPFIDALKLMSLRTSKAKITVSPSPIPTCLQCHNAFGPFCSRILCPACRLFMCQSCATFNHNNEDGRPRGSNNSIRMQHNHDSTGKKKPLELPNASGLLQECARCTTKKNRIPDHVRPQNPRLIIKVLSVSETVSLPHVLNHEDQQIAPHSGTSVSSTMGIQRSHGPSATTDTVASASPARRDSNAISRDESPAKVVLDNAAARTADRFTVSLHEPALLPGTSESHLQLLALSNALLRGLCFSLSSGSTSSKLLGPSKCGDASPEFVMDFDVESKEEAKLEMYWCDTQHIGKSKSSSKSPDASENKYLVGSVVLQDALRLTGYGTPPNETQATESLASVAQALVVVSQTTQRFNIVVDSHQELFKQCHVPLPNGFTLRIEVGLTLPPSKLLIHGVNHPNFLNRLHQVCDATFGFPHWKFLPSALAQPTQAEAETILAEQKFIVTLDILRNLFKEILLDVTRHGEIGQNSRNNLLNLHVSAPECPGSANSIIRATKLNQSKYGGKLNQSKYDGKLNQSKYGGKLNQSKYGGNFHNKLKQQFKLSAVVKPKPGGPSRQDGQNDMESNTHATKMRGDITNRIDKVSAKRNEFSTTGTRKPEHFRCCSNPETCVGYLESHAQTIAMAIQAVNQMYTIHQRFLHELISGQRVPALLHKYTSAIYHVHRTYSSSWMDIVHMTKICNLIQKSWKRKLVELLTCADGHGPCYQPQNIEAFNLNTGDQIVQHLYAPIKRFLDIGPVIQHQLRNNSMLNGETHAKLTNILCLIQDFSRRTQKAMALHENSDLLNLNPIAKLSAMITPNKSTNRWLVRYGCMVSLPIIASSDQSNLQDEVEVCLFTDALVISAVQHRNSNDQTRREKISKQIRKMVLSKRVRSSNENHSSIGDSAYIAVDIRQVKVVSVVDTILGPDTGLQLMIHQDNQVNPKVTCITLVSASNDTQRTHRHIVGPAPVYPITTSATTLACRNNNDTSNRCISDTARKVTGETRAIIVDKAIRQPWQANPTKIDDKQHCRFCIANLETNSFCGSTSCLEVAQLTKLWIADLLATRRSTDDLAESPLSSLHTYYLE